MISKRLKTITTFIEQNDKIVDVGCDHGLLSIYLYQNKLCELIIASDKNSSALLNAINNIKMQNLTEKIKTVLSSGVDDIDLDKYKINTLILAGMGTHTILDILSNQKTNRINKLIVQSNKDYYLLRKNLTKNNFYIDDEIITYDNKKYYLTICFKRGYKRYTEKDYYFGIIKKESLDYYKYILNNHNLILNKIPKKRFILRIKTKRLIKMLNNIINNI